MLRFNGLFNMSRSGERKGRKGIISCLSLFYNVFMWEGEGAARGIILYLVWKIIFFSINRKASEGEY